MVNTQIRQFRDSIIELTNASSLPIEIKRLVFAEVVTAISNEAEKAISEEKATVAKKQEDEESGE